MTHAARLFAGAKLGLSTRAEIAAWAVRHELAIERTA